jgi:predicted transcriptional regulator
MHIISDLEVLGMSEKPKVSPERQKEMQERARERNVIIKGLKDQGPATLDELSKTTGIEKEKLFKHMIAMRQFGKIAIAGERDNQLVYGLPEGEPTTK